MKHLLIILTYLFCINTNTSQNQEQVIVLDSTANQIDLKEINRIISTKRISSIKIDSLLTNKGYFDYKIIKIDTTNNKTILHTYIGVKKKILKITYNNKDSLPEEIKKLLKAETILTIPITETELFLSKLSHDITDIGYTFNNVSLKKLTQIDETTFKALLHISIINKKRNISNVIIKGYNKFPKTYIKRYLDIKQKETFNIEEIRKKSKRTKNLTFVEEVKSPEILFTKDSTKIYLYLAKKNANNFDGFIGFNTKEETKKLEFTGYLNLNLINNLNFGERFTIIYKSDESEQKNFQAELELPYLFNSPIGIEAGLRIFNRDSSFTNSTTNIKSVFITKKNLKYKIGYQTTKSNTIESTSINNAKNFESTYLTAEFGLKTIDSNTEINNIKTSVTTTLLIGSRKLDSSKTNQTRLNLTLKNRFYLNKKNALDIKLNTASLFSKDYLTNELTRIGGINSIRGFSENSIETSFHGITNIEYHYLINKTISINTITDFGYIENNTINQKQKLYSLGVGLNALTKAGILKLTLANGTTEESKLKFKNAQIHLSLIAYF